MTAPDPAQRPTAAQVHDRLAGRGIFAPDPALVAGPPTQPLPVLRRPVAARRATVAASAVVLAGLLGLGWVTGRPSGSDGERPLGGPDGVAVSSTTAPASTTAPTTVRVAPTSTAPPTTAPPTTAPPTTVPVTTTARATTTTVSRQARCAALRAERSELREELEDVKGNGRRRPIEQRLAEIEEELDAADC